MIENFILFKLRYELLNFANTLTAQYPFPFMLQTWLHTIPLVKIFAYHGYILFDFNCLSKLVLGLACLRCAEGFVYAAGGVEHYHFLPSFSVSRIIYDKYILLHNI